MAGGGTVRLGRGRTFVFDRLELRVVEGPDEGREIVSTAPECLVGTAEGCDLRLGDGSVSRHHCSLQSTPKGILLKDLESTNGTILNGVRIEAAYIEGISQIRVGESLIRCRRLEERAQEELGKEDHCGSVLGTSPAMRRIFGWIRRVAPSDCPVLIDGETGTGKGLVAETIHRESSRAKGPFVVLDCAGIAPTLLESELFGHAKGAFTGAYTARKGVLESARGGTVFLDEIGELPLGLQPKLLRALEEQSIRPVGTVETVHLDVRIIAATNRDLRREVNRETFRSDLFYRLNVMHITLPPLRERREDIPMLVAHYYAKYVGKDRDPEPPLAMLEAFSKRQWPGNVRELRNAVQRAVVLWEGVGQDSVEPDARVSEGEARVYKADTSFREAKEEAVGAWERKYVAELLRAHGGNISGASRTARMDRHHLRDLLKKYGVRGQEE